MSTNTQAENRWKTITQLWRNERFVYQLIGGLLLVLIGVWFGAKLFEGDNGYFTNLYTEVLGIAVTIFVLNALARRREDQRDTARLKEDLIRRIGSQVNITAVSAANELAKRNWLNDGSLRGADLGSANLKGAYLRDADLQGAYLAFANLEGANLRNANLREADLTGVQFDETTILPDTEYDRGTNQYTRYYSKDIDMTKFTDPNHQDFWQLCYAKDRSN